MVEVTKLVKGVWHRTAEAVRLGGRVLMHNPKALFLAGIIIGSFVGHTISVLVTEASYRLSNESTQLIGGVNAALASKLKLDKTVGAYRFNADAVTPEMTGESDPAKVAALLTSQKQQTGGGGKDSQNLYSLDLPIDPSMGTKIYDVNSKTSFKLIPEFEMGSGRSENGRVVYPLDEGGQAVYTVKANGIKEDIVLQKPRGDALSFKYTLELPKTLEARLDERGNLGIYSVDPAVSSAIAGALQNGVGSTDTERLKDVQENGTKNHLVYLIPAPTIVQSGDRANQHTAKAMYKLNGSQLTVETTGLEALTYPISIDPTVVVTSASDFVTGNDEGMIQFDTDAITRATPSAGSVGSWATTTSLVEVSSSIKSVAYNGYLYALDGIYSTVRYAPINADGTIGTWTATTSFSLGLQAAAVYNGYLYVLQSSGATRYAPINANGTIGTWTVTTSFATGRSGFEAVAYNGYLYMAGGQSGGTTFFNDVQYAPINANGTLGTWTATSSFATGREDFALVIYNGYLYILSGWGSGQATFNDVQYASINNDGSLTPWSATASFTGARYAPAAVAYAGYMYVYGGTSYDDVQYAPINANGTLGTWTATSSFTTGRNSAGYAAYKGRLYLLGGFGTGQSLADVQFASIDATAPSSANVSDWTSTTPMGAGSGSSTAKVTTRANHGSATYNGYIYVVGGLNPAGTIVSSVHYAPLNAGGGIGTWLVATSLPAARAGLTALAINGYLYVFGGQDATGVYTTTVYYTTIAANGSLGGTWTTATGTPLPTPRSDAGIINYNGYLYLAGGLTTSNALTATVHYAAINANGSLGAWTATTSLTAARAAHAATAYNGYLYVIGGSESASAVATALYAPINANGTVGTWTSTASMPVARNYIDAQIYQGYIFIAGGAGGGVYKDTAIYAKMNANGTLGAWQTGTTFPGARSGHGTDIYNGYIYVTGGTDGANYFGSNFYATLSYGPPTTSIGTTSAWQAATATNLAVYGQTVAVYNNFVYLIGGYGGAAYRNDVRYAALNADGTIGTWTTSSNTMSLNRFNAAAVAYGGYLYVTGGQQGSGVFTNTTEYAPINADGTLGSWTTSGNTFTTARYGHVAAAYNGKLYVVGGGDSVNTALGDVKYATINTDGSLGTWTDTTATTANRDTDGFVYGGRLYILGGLNGTTYSNTIRYATINSDGTLSAWTTSGSTFTNARSRMAATAVNGYMYISGGGTSSPFGDLQYAPINADGTIGTWKSSNSLSAVSGAPAGYYYHSMIAHKGRLYSLAGIEGTGTAQAASYASVLNAQALAGMYSRQINLGQLSTLNSLSMNGLTPPGQATILFRTAGVDGVYGGWQSPSVLSGAPISNVQYVMYKVMFDDSLGTAYSATANASSVTDVTVDYTIVPTLTPENRLRQNKYFDGSGILQPLQTQ